MITKFLNFFNKKTKEETNITDSIFDIKISLRKNQSIDLDISIETTDCDDYIKNASIAKNYAEFLYTINSGGLTAEIINILIDQIKNENNENLINNIIYYWDNSIKEKLNEKNDETFISPSSVFTRYNTGIKQI